MPSKYISAWTPTDYEVYPPYINISFISEDIVRVAIRSDPIDNYSGTYTYIDIPRDVAIELFSEADDKVRYD